MKAGSYNTRTLSTIKSPAYLALMDDLESMIDSLETRRQRKAPTLSTAPKDGVPEEDQEAGKSGGEHRSEGRPGGSGSTSSTLNQTPSPQPAPSPSPTSRRSRLNLSTGHLSVPDSFPNAVKVIFAELGTLNVTRHPNAALDLIRSFLEKTIKAYAEQRNERIPAGPGGMIQLSQCLQWLEAHPSTLPGRPLVPVIKKLQSGKIKEYTASSTYLNDLNNNHNVYAEADEVHQVWNSMDSLFRTMFR